MKTLINNLVTILEAAIGSILSANIVIKGFDQAEPDQVPIQKYPYVAIDDGGERVEADTANSTQTRFYTVSFFLAVIVGKPEQSLDDILDLSDEVKTILELEANRQKDGHIWGINITPVEGQLDNNKFFRGRQINVDFREIEFNDYQEY